MNTTIEVLAQTMEQLDYYWKRYPNTNHRIVVKFRKDKEDPCRVI